MNHQDTADSHRETADRRLKDKVRAEKAAQDAAAKAAKGKGAGKSDDDVAGDEKDKK